MDYVKKKAMRKILNAAVHHIDKSVWATLEHISDGQILKCPKSDRDLMLGLPATIKADELIIDCPGLLSPYLLLAAQKSKAKKIYVGCEKIANHPELSNLGLNIKPIAALNEKVANPEKKKSAKIALWINLELVNSERLQNYLDVSQGKKVELYITGLIIPELYDFFNRFVSQQQIKHCYYFNQKGTLKMQLKTQTFTLLVEQVRQLLRHRDNIRNKLCPSEDYFALVSELQNHIAHFLAVKLDRQELLDFSPAKLQALMPLETITTTQYFQRLSQSQRTRFDYYEFFVHANSHLASLGHLGDNNRWLKWVQQGKYEQVRGMRPKAMKEPRNYTMLYEYQKIYRDVS